MDKDDYIFKSKEMLGKFELIEAEELFQDGELDRYAAEQNVLLHVFDVGDWVVMRRAEDG